MVINPGRGLLSVRVTLNLWIDVELDEGVRLPSGVLARCVSRVLTFILGCCVWRVIKTRNRVGNDPIVGNVVAAGTADVGRKLRLSVGEGDLVGSEIRRASILEMKVRGVGEPKAVEDRILIL